MNKEVYRRLSKAEWKFENTNRLRTSNSTLRIKYEGIKKLLEKKDKEIERLSNIINEIEENIDNKLKEFENNKDYFIDETTIKDLKNELQELKDGESC